MRYVITLYFFYNDVMYTLWFPPTFTLGGNHNVYITSL